MGGAPERADPERGYWYRDMAEQPTENPSEADEQAESFAPLPADVASGIGRWSGVWQLPVLLAGVTMLVLGVWSTLPEKKADNFGAALDSVEQFLEARNYAEAREHLDTIGPDMVRGSNSDRARFDMLRGDLVYLTQLQMHWDKQENHERILALYESAEQLDPVVDETHRQRWILTLAALGRYDEALAMLDHLEGPRYPVIRNVIERRSAVPETDPAELFELLAQFQEELRRETNTVERRKQELWATELTSHMMIVGGNPDQAIDHLLPKLIRLDDREGDEPGADDQAGDGLTPLMVNLAKAYQDVGDNVQARRWYSQAQQQLDHMDVLNAKIMVGLAQIALAETGDVQKALGYFASAEKRYPATEAYLDALIGRADCEAKLGSHPEAIEHFGQAVARVAEGPRSTKQEVTRLSDVIRSHYDLNFANDQTDRALDYLTLLLPLYGRELPTDLLLQFASTHARIGQERNAASATLLAATEREPDSEEPSARAEARRSANQDAAVQFKLAGDYYRRHASAVTVSDDEQHGASLWNAATSYDSAQRWDLAIGVYAEFVEWRDKDPKHLMAVHRLGLAYLADGQPEAAADKFEMLISEHPNGEPAHASLVPLARALIAMGRLDDAQEHLESVIDMDPAITPQSRHYREALIELGRLHYSRQDFTTGVPLLRTAVELYGDSRQGPALRFRWGDALRQSVAELDEALKQPLPQSRELALKQERTQRLSTAEGLFDQVVTDLSPESPEDLSKLERVFLRNAYFYRADCAYDQGRFEPAIDFYDEAAKRFRGEPISLVALMQIVNAYCELGQTDSARAVNHRARLQLRGIAEDKFDDPSLPISRRHWEDWLKWSDQLKRDRQSRAKTAAAGPG